MPESNTITTIAMLGVILYMFMRLANGLGSPYGDTTGFLGGLWDSATTPFRDFYGGTTNIIDSLNPFTEGPIFGWI